MGKLFKNLILFVVVFYGVTTGTLYFLQDQLLFPAPKLDVDAVEIAGFSKAVVSTRDGERLFALHHPAKGDEATILVFHGNGDAAINQRIKGEALAEAGFGVLLVEYRGYPGSTGSPSGNGLFLDGLAAYDFIADKFANPIGLYAHSLGTGVAVNLAAQRKVFAAVLESSYDSVMAVAQANYPWVPVQLLLRHKFRSDLFIEKVSAPLLMMHGDKDRVIPIKHGKELHRLVSDQAIFKIFEGAGHNNLLRYNSHLEAIRFFQLHEAQ